MLPGDSSGDADPENEHLVAPLFVWLPGTGEEPEDYTQILRMAAFAGYRTIGLSYHNDIDLEEQCAIVEDRVECAEDYWDECAFEIRWERINGYDDLDTDEYVEPEDSISYRLVEALAAAAAWDTGSDWHFNQYCTDSGGCAAALSGGGPDWMPEIDWSRTVVAGFSQGAGYPQWISLETEVDGIVCIDGGNDGCCVDNESPQDGCDEYDDLEQSTYYSALVDFYSEFGGASPGNGEFAALHEQHAFLDMDPPAVVPDTFAYVQLYSTVHEIDDDPLPLTSNVARTNQNWPADPVTCGYHSSMAVSDCMPSQSTWDEMDSEFVNTTSSTPHLHLFESYVEGFCNARALPPP